MIPEKAIRLAIDEGDFQFSGLPGNSQIAENPEFWQALSRALGWKEKINGFEIKDEKFLENIGVQGYDWDGIYWEKEKWKYHALRYFELKLTGGDEEKFWKELIGDNHE